MRSILEKFCCLLWINEAKGKDKIYMGCRCYERLQPNTKEFYVYYESIKREPKIRGMYECRCHERLQTKSKEFTRLAYTGLKVYAQNPQVRWAWVSCEPFSKFPKIALFRYPFLERKKNMICSDIRKDTQRSLTSALDGNNDGAHERDSPGLP
jgi:hypothetical protein